MPIKLKKYYLNTIRERYKKSTKKQKTFILSEFCVNSGYSRKHASRILKGVIEPRKVKSGPKPQYNTNDFLWHLKNIWEDMDRMCGKNMVQALPIWLLNYPEKMSKQIKEKLLKISASTIDRMLKPYKRSSLKGLSGTNPSSLKNIIPLRTMDSVAKCPGIVNADTVAHCGDSIAGNYINSLTITDLFSSWTVNRAIWKKESLSVLNQIKKAESLFPFNFIEFFSDNGNEFLNHIVKDYFEKRQAPVNFKRTRAYKKNDACYVEQKNYTHVRQLFGYQRIEQRELVSLMNEIYQAYANPLKNFFTPVMKLQKKERINSKIKKIYDIPKTPYQRLMESGYLTLTQKKYLRDVFKTLNPFFLKKELNKKLKILFQKIDEHNKFVKSNYDEAG